MKYNIYRYVLFSNAFYFGIMIPIVFLVALKNDQINIVVSFPFIKNILSSPMFWVSYILSYVAVAFTKTGAGTQ